MKIPKIIFEDKNIAVLEKPQGMPSQKGLSKNIDLLTWANQNLESKAEIKILNRLDQPVGGLVLLGKTGEAVKKLSSDIQNHRIKKDYLAIVNGTIIDEIAIHKDYLVKRKDMNLSEVYTGPLETMPKSAKLAEMSLKNISNKENLSLVNIRLKTGRHHQIRVQTSYHGIPIWGDTKYNINFSDNSETSNEWVNIALWAYKLSFRHPISKKILTFYSSPKAEFPWSLFDKQLYTTDSY